MQQMPSPPAGAITGSPAPAIFNPGTGSAPAALVSQEHLILDIIAWSATGACVAGILITAALMAISHHRGTGSEHFGSLGKVLTACILVATAGPIVQWLA
jgi:hypothetical protein